MKWYVYVLALKNGQRYYGFTRNVKNRLQAHQSWQVSSTKWQEPSLLAVKDFESVDEARAFERHLKKSRNKKYIAKLFDLPLR